MAAVDAPQGLKAAALRFAGGAVALVRTRLELAGVELALERERLQLRLTLLFAGVLLVLFGVLGLGAFVVVVFWESNRLAAILGVSGLCAAAGGFLMWKAREIGRESPQPFAATLAELEKDRTWISGRRAEE